MKSGRGGARPGAGRPASGRGERISVQPSKQNLEWLKRQSGSYSATLNALMDAARGKDGG